ncbi:MAG: 50S ribosomal protein L16 [Chloroflexi bacterium]|nr:50S ribosomal protein L16 [Chloroflexota bacterium]
MLMPKRTKYFKQMRGRMRGQARRGAEVHFGEYGLQALEPGWVSARQIEAARRAIVRETRRRGKVWIRIFPDKPVTQRAAETRMGKGKGNVEFWVAVVKPGRILFELGSLPADIAKEAMRLASHKLSIKTKFVVREEQPGE